MKRRMQVWPSDVMPGDVVWPGGNLWATQIVAVVEPCSTLYLGEPVPAVRLHFTNGDAWRVPPGVRVSVERDG